MQLGVRGGGGGMGWARELGEGGKKRLGWVGWCFFQGLPDEVRGPLLVWASGEAAPGRREGEGGRRARGRGR